MADSPVSTPLSAAETLVAEELLTLAWGERVKVVAAETIWGRDHVVRLHLGADRSAVLKRRGMHDHGRRDRGFGVELTALEYLNGMPERVAPRLLGSDTRAGILVMEDLGPGASLADSLLTGGRAAAQADLIAYARALGSLHAWSIGRPGELASQRVEEAPGGWEGPRLASAIGGCKEPFLAMAAALGLAADGAAAEIDQLAPMLNQAEYLGFVHGDACPDNVRLMDGRCRIFDFETSGWGPVVLDAAYLLAPFPSCWCFASLPREITAPAVDAYRACLDTAGITLGPDWDAAVLAALAGWIVVRGRLIGRLLEEDHQWGTTTVRPRLLAWLRTFIDQADAVGALPRLRVLAGVLHDRLSARWPDLRIPDYPALARPGSALAEVPAGWETGM